MPARRKEDEKTSIPPLHNGDHLTRAEFERRYQAQPHLKKAELIEGVVYVPSPVSIDHSRRHATVMAWLGAYRAATPGLLLLDNASVRLDAENEVQPDAALCLAEGGQTEVVGNFLHGAPELVVEIAGSSAAYDLHEKLRVYRRAGVREYVILLALEQETIWYHLDEGRYVAVSPDMAGIIRSVVFPGLHFHSAKFWADDLSGLLADLAAGMATPEHAAFVEIIQARANSNPPLLPKT
jgi:Uma2 family endonuclease